MKGGPTHISFPYIGGEHLICLVKVQNLDEYQRELHFERLWAVPHRASNSAGPQIPLTEITHQLTLVRKLADVIPKIKQWHTFFTDWNKHREKKKKIIWNVAAEKEGGA